jgi:hypothetical protein
LEAVQRSLAVFVFDLFGQARRIGDGAIRFANDSGKEGKPA